MPQQVSKGRTGCGLADSAEARHHRARIAALTRDRAPDDPELLDARTKFAEAKREMLASAAKTGAAKR